MVYFGVVFVFYIEVQGFFKFFISAQRIYVFSWITFAKVVWFFQESEGRGIFFVFFFISSSILWIFVWQDLVWIVIFVVGFFYGFYGYGFFQFF